MTDLFSQFDQVRIINLVDRPDRRREMERQLQRVGAIGPNVSFFAANRPDGPGEFPSTGARGCFESHLSVLRDARNLNASSLLILEDDFDFSRDGLKRLPELLEQLSKVSWDFFYGAHQLPLREGSGLFSLASDRPIVTASFLAFSGRVVPHVVEFLEAILKRPAGSPEYGPMHVDGAYTVFRESNPEFVTFAAFPPFGRQRSSRSDITPGDKLLDRWGATRKAMSIARKTYNWWRRH